MKQQQNVTIVNSIVIIEYLISNLDLDDDKICVAREDFMERCFCGHCVFIVMVSIRYCTTGNQILFATEMEMIPACITATRRYVMILYVALPKRIGYYKLPVITTKHRRSSVLYFWDDDVGCQRPRYLLINLFQSQMGTILLGITHTTAASAQVSNSNNSNPEVSTREEKEGRGAACRRL